MQNAEKNRKEKQILIIFSEFHSKICKDLVEIAETYLETKGLLHHKVKVPGAFEIPAALSFACMTEKFDGYIALGCVIKSQTPHFDYVCTESCRKIADIVIEKRIAFGFGLITSNTQEEAIKRSDPKNPCNYAIKAAKACLEMIKIKEGFIL